VTRATSPQSDIPTVADRITTRQNPTSATETVSTAGRFGPLAEALDEEAIQAGDGLNSDLTEKLWQSRIVAPDPNEDAETRLALARLIKQIRSVQFEPREQRSVFSMPPEPEEPDLPNTVESTRDGAWEDTMEPAAASPPAPETALPAETAKLLSRLVQNPDRVQDPLELAELLFLSDRWGEAAVFYRKALELLDMEAATAHEDRAWILFQLGNSLRETNMTEAKDAYTKLIAEYPDSPWTELAKAHGRLITWYQKARPTLLVSGSNR
jgi:tetratricopeptide (TPR) repeat protein